MIVNLDMTTTLQTRDHKTGMAMTLDTIETRNGKTTSYWAQLELLAGFCGDNGAVIYYATAVGPRPQTHDLSKWNYIHWQTFKPWFVRRVLQSRRRYHGRLLNTLPGLCRQLRHSNGAALAGPLCHRSARQAQGNQIRALVGRVAGHPSSLIVALNGQTLIWHAGKKSDPQVRSGLSGLTSGSVSVERQPTETARTDNRHHPSAPTAHRV